MRSSIYLCIFLVILLAPLAIAQSSVHIPDQYKKAEQFYNLENSTEETDRKALQLYLEVAKQLAGHPEYDSIIFNCYLKAGILQQSANQQEQSVTSFMSANGVQEHSALADSFRFKPYLFIGSAYYALNNFDSASYYFKEAEQLAIKYPNISELERLYNKTGTMFYETGNYLQSKFYFEKALATLDTSASSNLYLLVNYKNNIASALRKMHQYSQALDIYQSLLSTGIEKEGLRQNIGDTYLAMGEYTRAIPYLKETNYYDVKRLNDLAYCYLSMHNIDSASYYLDMANRRYLMANQVEKSINKGITSSHWGELHVIQKLPLLALHYFQYAIIEMDPDFNDTSITSNPIQFEGIHSFSNLFEVLARKAEAFAMLFDSTKNIQDLVNALSTMRSAFLLSDKAAQTYDTDDARLFLNENLQPAYQSYVSWCIQFYHYSHERRWLKEAIAMAEKSKAAVLQSSLLQLPLLNIKGIPRDLLQQEKNLKAGINRFNIQLSTVNDPAQSSTLQQQILNAQIDLSRIHEQLNQESAYKSLWKNKSVDIDNLQEQLSNDEAICTFYFAKNELICFSITKDSISYNVSKSVDPLVKEITFLAQHTDDASADMQQTRNLLQGIYRQLIEPLLPFIHNKKRLTLIPHNELAYVPFEMLIDESGHYLLETFATSYNYSLAFLKEDHSAQQNKLLVGFAPFAAEANPSKGFESIPASRKEVSSLSGEVLIDSAATKQKFLQLTSQIGVAHLATHAAANDSVPLQSFIAFYPQGSDTSFKLYEPEIYNLDMHASKLVVLSACETGTGKLVHGEGLLSLSRAFSYAGCPSIITSLWKADDVATAYICSRLHHYLSKGWKKDIALQRAKLDYLRDDAIADQYKVPRFWANLVLVGDASPIHTSVNFTTVLLALVIAVLGFVTGLWIYKKRKARSASLVS